MVASAHDNRNDETLGVPTTRLMRAETNAYVENQKKADNLRNISGYVNWAATGLMGLFAILSIATMFPGAPLVMTLLGSATAVEIPAIALIGAGVGAVVSMVTSNMLSNKATEISEKGNVLYSDIDSQNQAHRMVQAFAKAQTQGQVQADNSAPMTSTNTNWSDRVGSPAQASGSWQERVAAQAEREEVQSLNAVSAVR